MHISFSGISKKHLAVHATAALSIVTEEGGATAQPTSTVPRTRWHLPVLRDAMVVAFKARSTPASPRLLRAVHSCSAHRGQANVCCHVVLLGTRPSAVPSTLCATIPLLSGFHTVTSSDAVCCKPGGWATGTLCRRKERACASWFWHLAKAPSYVPSNRAPASVFSHAMP